MGPVEPTCEGEEEPEWHTQPPTLRLSKSNSPQSIDRSRVAVDSERFRIPVPSKRPAENNAASFQSGTGGEAIMMTAESTRSRKWPTRPSNKFLHGRTLRLLRGLGIRIFVTRRQCYGLTIRKITRNWRTACLCSFCGVRGDLRFFFGYGCRAGTISTVDVGRRLRFRIVWETFWREIERFLWGFCF